MKDQINTIRAALERAHDESLDDKHIECRDTLRIQINALAQLEAMAGEQEPVAEVYRHGKDSHGREWHGIHWYDPNLDVPSGTKLYTVAPVAQHQEPVGRVDVVSTPFGDKLKPVLEKPVPVGAKLFVAPVAQLEAMVGEPVLIVQDGEICYKSKSDDQSYGMWCPVTPDADHGLSNGTKLYAAPVAQQPVMVDMVPPATARDRWMYEQGRLAERDARTHAAQQPQAEAVPQDVGQLEYRGNSVAYIHQKMTAYRSAIDAAWESMRDAGHPPDGRTPLAQAITKALAPQQAEADSVAWDNCRAEYQCRSWCGNSSCVSHAAQGAKT